LRIGLTLCIPLRIPLWLTLRPLWRGSLRGGKDNDRRLVSIGLLRQRSLPPITRGAVAVVFIRPFVFLLFVVIATSPAARG
jgi:hypothetical protein